MKQINTLTVVSLWILSVLFFWACAEVNRQSKEFYNNRGIAYYHKGEYDQSIQEFNKAIEINPRYAEAYYSRGNAYGQKGQYDRAIQNYNKAIDINPRYAEAYSNRGLVYFVKLGDKENGWSDWKRACELGKCRKYHPAKRKGDCK